MVFVINTNNEFNRFDKNHVNFMRPVVLTSRNANITGVDPSPFTVNYTDGDIKEMVGSFPINSNFLIGDKYTDMLSSSTMGVVSTSHMLSCRRNQNFSTATFLEKERDLTCQTRYGTQERMKAGSILKKFNRQSNLQSKLYIANISVEYVSVNRKIDFIAKILKSDGTVVTIGNTEHIDNSINTTVGVNTWTITPLFLSIDLGNYVCEAGDRFILDVVIDFDGSLEKPGTQSTAMDTHFQVQVFAGASSNFIFSLE